MKEKKTTKSKEEKIRTLVSELFGLTDLEGVLTEALEQGKTSSSEIIAMSDMYEESEASASATSLSNKLCIEAIENALENAQPSLPSASEVMGIISTYYESAELLNTDAFLVSDMFDRIENSWEMNDYRDRIRSEYQEKLDRIENSYEMAEERTLLDALEESTPDELWSMFADYGRCSNHDNEKMRAAVFKLISNLTRSNYNRDRLFDDIMTLEGND